MAAETAAIGTALVTGYGIANDFSKTPSGQNFVATARNAQLQLEMTTLKAEVARLKKQVADCDVNAVRERAKMLEERMRKHAEEWKKTQRENEPQVGGTRPPKDPADVTLGDVEDLKTDAKMLLARDPKAYAAIQSHGDQLRQITGYIESEPFPTTKSLFKLYRGFLNSLERGYGSFDYQFGQVMKERAKLGLGQGAGAPASPTVSVSTSTSTSTDPSPPSPPAPAPAPAPPAVVPEPPAPAPAPPAEDPLTQAANALVSGVTGKTNDPEVDALLDELKTALDALTVDTVRQTYDAIRGVEAKFSELEEKRKFENTPEGQKIRWTQTMAAKLSKMTTSVAELWTTMAANMPRVPAKLVRDYFEVWHALRMLQADYDGNRLSIASGDERFDVIETEFKRILAEYTALGLPAPRAPPGPPPDPAPPGPPPGPAPAPGPGGEGAGVPDPAPAPGPGGEGAPAPGSAPADYAVGQLPGGWWEFWSVTGNAPYFVKMGDNGELDLSTNTWVRPVPAPAPEAAVVPVLDPGDVGAGTGLPLPAPAPEPAPDPARSPPPVHRGRRSASPAPPPRPTPTPATVTSPAAVTVPGLVTIPPPPPEPVVEPAPAPAPAPVVEPAPAPAPAPVVEPAPAPAPAPVAAPGAGTGLVVPTPPLAPAQGEPAFTLGRDGVRLKVGSPVACKTFPQSPGAPKYGTIKRIYKQNGKDYIQATNDDGVGRMEIWTALASTCEYDSAELARIASEPVDVRPTPAQLAEQIDPSSQWYGNAPAPAPVPAPAPEPAPAPAPRRSTLSRTITGAMPPRDPTEAQIERERQALGISREELEKAAEEEMEKLESNEVRKARRAKDIASRRLSSAKTGLNAQSREILRLASLKKPIGPASNTPQLSTSEGQKFVLPNPMRAKSPQATLGAPLPGARGPLGSIGTPGVAELSKKFTSPPPTGPSSRAGTVRLPGFKRNINPAGGRRRTLRKKTLTSRRGNKTNGK